MTSIATDLVVGSAARWQRIAGTILARYGLVPLRRRTGLVLSVLGVVFLALAILVEPGVVGYDGIAYWHIDLGHLYHFTGVGDDFGAFRYSPVVAQVLDPLGVLPWPAFYASWAVLSLLALRVVGRYGLALLLFLPATLDIYFANLSVLIGVALGLAVRWPAAFALPILTKISPGVGVLWFVGRRDWRAVAIALAATVGIAAVSLLTTPSLWTDWIQSLASLGPDGYHSLPLLPRVAVAGVLCLWGGVTNRAWTVVLAGWIASPGMDLKTAAVLVGVPLAIRLGPTRPQSSTARP